MELCTGRVTLFLYLTGLAAKSLIETSKRTVGILLDQASYNHLQGFHVKHVANQA